MSYFTSDYIAFFEELSNNNVKSWFDNSIEQHVSICDILDKVCPFSTERKTKGACEVTLKDEEGNRISGELQVIIEAISDDLNEELDE